MTVPSGEAAREGGARTARALLIAGVSVGLAFFLRQTAEVFVPFTLALVLALASYPLIEWLAEHRVPPQLSVVLLVLLILILLGVVVLLTEQGVGSLMTNLPQFKSRASALWASGARKLGI